MFAYPGECFSRLREAEEIIHPALSPPLVFLAYRPVRPAAKPPKSDERRISMNKLQIGQSNRAALSAKLSSAWVVLLLSCGTILMCLSISMMKPSVTVHGQSSCLLECQIQYNACLKDGQTPSWECDQVYTACGDACIGW